MTPSIKINLTGNLGVRHRCLNASVRDAHQKNTPFHLVQNQPEKAPTDRLFKIDLASKQKNVDYIIRTLKDDDILYVTRALKSSWLFEEEYSNIINPRFLEYELYSQMTLQAINKMRHCIQTHLKDQQRCSEFYQFYKARDFEKAAKFLWHCSNEYIIAEIKDVLDKITPKHMKLLSEKVPQVSMIYYDHLKDNEILLQYYLNNDLKFFANIKYLLKSDADVFFYVVENFFVNEKFPAFSAEITKYILRHHKDRFIAKPELYTAWFLNMEALTKCLNPVEAKDLIIKVAKAEFLGSWFTYKRVEPLIKSLCEEERTAFKKIIFVDRAFGPTVKEWPYPKPVPPVLAVSQTALFEDRKMKPPLHMERTLCSLRIDADGSIKSVLDQLFDQYRFSSFKQTLVKLRKRLRAESSPRNRQYMLLVLVSKTGGRAEDLASLLDLLSHYKNEPLQVRAAIVRSLVKRAFVWRLAPEHWAKLLEWGHGLGLNGGPTEIAGSENSQDDSKLPKRVPSKAKLLRPLKRGRGPVLVKRGRGPVLVDSSAEIACNEGLHAVVIRDLLANVTPKEAVWKSFLAKFSPLAEYSLSSDERNYIRTRLPTWLLAEAQSRPEIAVNRLHFLLDTLSAYHTRFDEFPGAIDAIAATAKSDLESAKSLLSRLYKARVARNTLIREYFDLIQTDDSYVNALRHDTTILETTKRFEKLLDRKDLKHEKFLRKLSLYFTEKDGLCERYRAVLEIRVTNVPDKRLARPLAMFAGSTFPSLLKVFDVAPPKTPQRQLAAALRSNAHVVRPPLDLESLGWCEMGAKALANRIATCRQKDLDKYLPKTLSWGRTLRLALVLAKRTNKEYESYEVFASKRPGAALKAALKYFQREGNNSDLRIWHSVKSHIAKYDQRRCHYSITNMDSIPAVIKAEYCSILYQKYKSSSKEIELLIMYHIPDILHEMKNQFSLEEIEELLRNASTGQIISRQNYYGQIRLYLYVVITARYLLLSTTEEELEERFRRIGLPFFKVIEVMWKRFGNTSSFSAVEHDFLDQFLSSLNYNQAFFNEKYASCSTVFEKLTEWMHSLLLIEKWFDKFVEVHLMTIYLETVRYCLKQSPEVFSDESKKLEEGVYMLGTIFGKFIANVMKDLIEKYYPSVINLYAQGLERYLMRTYYYKYDKSIEIFIKALLVGMLSTKELVPVYILATHIYKVFGQKLKDDCTLNNILRSFQSSENKELSFRALQDDII